MTVRDPIRRGQWRWPSPIRLRSGAALLVALWVCAAFPIARSPMAQDALTIAAVVNDEAISMIDLFARTKLTAISTGQQPSREAFDRLMPQVLDVLINETLQLQEAKRVDVKVPEQEVNAEIEDIAKRNNLTREQFIQAMQADGIPPTVLSRQIEAQIAWSRAISRGFAARTEVTPAEIDSALEELRRAPPGEEYELQEIYLAVDLPSEAERKRVVAERALADLRRGVDFDALAREISENGAKRDGGRLGWVRSTLMPTDLAVRLADLPKGQTSSVIRSKVGFHIFRMLDRRRVERGNTEVTYDLRQIFVPLPANAPGDYAARAQAVAAAASQEVRGCTDISRVLSAYGLADHSDLGRMNAKDLPQSVRNVVSLLSPGQATGPLRLDTGLAVLVLCNRIEERTDLPSREEISTKLRNDRLSVLARRHLRDLRRSAIIDYRMAKPPA